jgi:formylglycine-generating enzyme required for sulfatase activity
VGRGAANAWGVHDLHGLVWEWVEDFNASLAAVDNREDGGSDLLQYCGAGSLAAADKSDYAAFMRVAYRSALDGHSTTRSLGFRCAWEAP